MYKNCVMKSGQVFVIIRIFCALGNEVKLIKYNNIAYLKLQY